MIWGREFHCAMDLWEELVLVLGCSGHCVSELLSMEESGHRIDSSVLEWSLWEVSLVIDYLVHMTESGLFSPINKSRDVALTVQVLPVSGPTQSELALCYTVAKALGRGLYRLEDIKDPSKVITRVNGVHLKP